MDYTAKVGVSPAERNVVGWVIGKGGSGIKDILGKSGAKSIDYISVHSEWIVKGTPKSVDRAIKMLKNSTAAKMERSSRQPMGYHVNAPEFGRVLKGERQGAERDMAKESSESGARPPSPLQNGFGVLDMLDGKTMAEVEAEREAERKRDQELNAKLREIRRAHEREMDEERTRALTKSMDDLKISSSELEKRNQKFASGTVVYKKPSIEDEVLGGAAATTGKKGKRNRVRKEGPVNLTKDVLPKRTVDLRALRKHNNAVFAKEKAEREARKRAWEERKSKSKAKAPVVEETTVEASPEPTEEYRCANRKRRLSDEETEYERPSSRPRTETPEPEPEDPIDKFVDVALTNMSRFASNRMNWARIFGIKITFQPQSELGVGATTAKVMLSGNLKKVWRFMAHLEYTFPNTFTKKESPEESGSPSPTIEARVRNGEMGSFKMDDTRCLTPEDEEHIDEYFAEVDRWGSNAACA